MLVDSNILIYGANGSRSQLDVILDRTDLAAASVRRIETLGFHRLSEAERGWLEIAFDRMRVLPLDEHVEQRAIELRQQKNMALGDAVIAATALVHGLKLVTRNVADFEHITGLELLNSFDPT